MTLIYFVLPTGSLHYRRIYQILLFIILGPVVAASEKHLEHFRYIAKGYLNLVIFVFKAPGLAHVENVYAKPLFTNSWIWLLFILILASIVMYVMVIILRGVSPDTE